MNKLNLYSVEGKTDAEKIRHYLSSYQDKYEKFVSCAYNYIMKIRVTHYIDKITLGAAKFSTISNLKFSTEGKAGFGAGVKQSGKAEASIQAKHERCVEHYRGKEIGKLDDVYGPRGEGVIEYEISPIYTLVQTAKVKEILKDALTRYLERESEYNVYFNIFHGWSE